MHVRRQHEAPHIASVRHAMTLWCTCGSVLALLVSPAAVMAQQPDSARGGAVPSPSALVPRQAAKAPLSPRRAFLYSLAVPGSAQSILDRPGAGALFVTVEAGSLAMIAKSLHDLRVARRLSTDSLVVGFDTAGTGVSGRMPRAVRIASPLAARVPARKAFVEDWVTLLIVNHFLSGADAFVAAQLWDVPTDVGLTPSATGGLMIRARLRW